jgi:hypothetical protein
MTASETHISAAAANHASLESEVKRPEQRFHRKITLQTGGRHFYIARSQILLRDVEIQDQVAGGCIGLGQIFKQLGVMPVFQLRGAGNLMYLPRLACCSKNIVSKMQAPTPLWMWREYTLADPLGS